MERIILEIIDLTDQGSGLAKTKDNRVVFVPLTVPGDLVECDISQKRKNIWQALNIEIVKQSSDRVAPPCEYFPNKPNEIGCGGCQIQHLNYQRLLDFKEKFVKDKLQRIGGINLSDIDMKPILQMEKPWHYRNHVQLKIEYDDTLDQFRKGFFSNTSHKIVNHKTCYISQTGEELIWRTIDEFLIQSPLREIFKRHWKELIIRSGENTDQLLLAFVLDSIPTNIDDSFKSEWAEFSKIFQATDSSKKLVSIWLLAENDVDKDLNVYGYPYFSEKLLGKEFQIYPRSFFQVNSKQVEKTYSILVEFIAQEKIKTRRTLYDLYCGTGTIGLILSEYFTQVKGVAKQ